MTPRLSPVTPGVVVLERTDTPASATDPDARVHVVHVRKTVKYGVRADGRSHLTSSTARHYKGRASWNSEKTFSRWATDLVTHISTLPGEPWRLSSFSTGVHGRKAGWSRDVIFAETLPHRLESSMRERAELLLPPAPSIFTYYPLLRHYVNFDDLRGAAGPYGNPGTTWAPAEIRRAFANTDTVQELTRRLFGKTRYRRDLVKAVASSNLPTIALAWQFRGLVPIDWIVSMLRERPLRPGRYLNNIRPHLRNLDQMSLRNVLRDAAILTRYARDLARFSPVADLGRIHSVTELHDRLYEHALLFRTAYTKTGKPKKAITLPDYASALGGQLSSGWSIEIARHENDLWEWGSLMRHCIGVYGPHLRSGRSILGAVCDPSGRMRANFEVTATRRRHVSDAQPDERPVLRLSQLLGRANSLLPADVQGPVLTHLRATDVEIPGDYWGAVEVPGMVEAA